MLKNDRGYVIRKHDLFDGKTTFRGQSGIIKRNKDGFTIKDTYTFSGAKRAISNMRRLCYDPDEIQFCIERLDECYFDMNLTQENSQKKDEMRERQIICQYVEKAMTRLDELWNGNNFNNGDKMRINEVRFVLRELKEKILNQ